MRIVEGMTPYEARHRRKLSVEHLRTFGYIIYIKNTKLNPKKILDRSTKMVFVDYKKGSKAYRAYDTHTRWVHVACDAMFDELSQ
jgi:hypothetical protein